MNRPMRAATLRIASIVLILAALGCVAIAWSYWHIHLARGVFITQPERASRLLVLAGPQAGLLPEYHELQGRIALAGDDAQAAQASFQRYVDQQRGAPEAWGYLAVAHALAYDLDAARRSLDEALRLGPFEPELIGILADRGPLIARQLTLDQRARVSDLLHWYAQSNPLVAVDSAERLGMLFVICDAATSWPRDDWNYDRMNLACAKKGVAEVESDAD